jgi:hypothetical protein
LGGVFLVGLALPRLANHYNFALPGANGLPYRVSFNNRTYINPSVCAGADWCKNEKPVCLTREYLADSNQWPLKPVGEVPTLFGPAHSIMLPASYSNLAITGIFILYAADCYLAYGLEGGLMSGAIK